MVDTLPYDPVVAMENVPPHDPAPLSHDTPKRFADFKCMKDATLVLGEPMPSEEARTTVFNCLEVLIQISFKTSVTKIPPGFAFPEKALTAA